MRGMSSWW